MSKLKPVLLFSALLLLALFYGCRDDSAFDVYERPDWLAGKLYTQILEQEELSTFAKCVELVGYDTIINVSGSYTAFAPSNQAFDEWLAQKSEFNSVEDIPIDELTKIVKYHLVQNPWTKAQLRSLDVYGWIDTLDVSNNKPRGFKRETLLRTDNRKYGVASGGKRDENNNENVIIVDTLNTSWHRMVATDSRKYAPFFYQEYFDIYDLDPSDYEFYFNRPFTGGNDIFFAGARIEGDEIFAENGFVYVIDKVVEPLQNVYQILEEDYPSYSYSFYRDLLNEFPDFNYNESKTFDQPGAEEGLEVDSLFDLTFNDLVFDITNEKTQPPTGTFGLPPNVTIRYHHGMLAPTNQAFENLINEYIRTPGGWGDLDNTPKFIKGIIANTYLSVNPVYPTDIEQGFYNGEKDIVRLDESNIIQKEFGSNSSFIGLNEAIVPRAFSSVAGPVYLQRGYEKVLLAVERTGLLPALKRENKNYMFFVEPDASTSQDSSLLYDSFEERFFLFEGVSGTGSGSGSPLEYSLSVNDLRTLLLNHIAIDNPRGIARKEFIPNLAGKFIIVNNETGEISGNGETTYGYKGLETVPEFPQFLSTANNGSTYRIGNWFSFKNVSLFVKMSLDFPKFHGLLRKAGLANDSEFRYRFISESDFYTVFVPSDAAIDSANVDDLPKEELKNFLLGHFIQGDLIFTDGNKPAGYYETMRENEEGSTQFSTVYRQVFIEPGIDIIQFKNDEGADYAQVIESEKTNQMTGVNTEGDDEEGLFPSFYINTVIHEVDNIILPE